MTGRKNTKGGGRRATPSGDAGGLTVFDLPYFLKTKGGRRFSRARILIAALEDKGVKGAKLAAADMDHVLQYSYALEGIKDANPFRRSLRRDTFERLLSEAILSASVLGLEIADGSDADVASLARDLAARHRREAGKLGAAKRHQPLAALRAFAVQQYRAKQWASAADAARKLLPEITARAKALGALPFTATNAERTVTKWLRAAKTKLPSSG
jgi:hypothetical protein